MRSSTQILGFLVCVACLSAFASAQGGGNARDFRMTSSVSSGATTDAAKLIRTNDQLEVAVSTPNGSLLQQPILVGVDVRSRHVLESDIVLPGEPQVCGLTSQLFFLVEGTGTVPALIPGLHTLEVGGNAFSFQLPDLTPLGPIALWVQAVTLDALAPNGLAFSRTVRHDTELLSTTDRFTDLSYGAAVYAGYGLAALDLNGDGRDEILLGLPGADPQGVLNGGELQVLDGVSRQLLYRLRAPQLSWNAWFGNAIRAGDVTGDQQVDLIVGARQEEVSGLTSAGAVYVFVGPDFQQVLRIVSPTPEASARYGHALELTDWNADGLRDVVVGEPKGSAGGFGQAGRVQVHLAPAFQSVVTIANPEPVFGAKFGYALAGGDFNGDGQGDLCIGAPYHDTQGIVDTGRAYVYSAATLQQPILIAPAVPADSLLGAQMSAADVNGDGMIDLAIGAEFEAGSVLGAGAVHLVYGPNFQTELVLRSPEPTADGGFGSDVALGDLNRDGHCDVLSGEFWRNEAGLTRAGRAIVHFGPVFDQHLVLNPAIPVQNAEFGRRVAVGDLDGDSYGDALISAPFEMVPGTSFPQVGTLNLFR